MASDSELIGQGEMDELLQRARDVVQPPAGSPAEGSRLSPDPPSLPADAGSAAVTTMADAAAQHVEPGQAKTASATGDDIQFLLDQAAAAIASVQNPTPPLPELTAFQFRDLAGEPASQEKATLDALSDVELDLKIELGRTQMQLEDVLKLRRGSVVALDKLAGDPVDVYVNGRLIARGEVLVLNDNFCVRVAELVAGDDRS
jgi:flagellar motor switch protein FliN/FliY